MCAEVRHDKEAPTYDIQLSTQPGAPYGIDPTQIQVVLQTPPNITWWKEIKAFDAWGSPISWVDAQKNVHGPVTMTIDTRTALWLVFSKAATLGHPHRNV